MNGILLWVGFGALIGWVYGAIFKDKAGIAKNIFLGIVGAVAGGVIYNAAVGSNLNDFSLVRFTTVILGAVGLLVLRHLVAKQMDKTINQSTD